MNKIGSGALLVATLAALIMAILLPEHSAALPYSAPKIDPLPTSYQLANAMGSSPGLRRHLVKELPPACSGDRRAGMIMSWSLNVWFNNWVQHSKVAFSTFFWSEVVFTAVMFASMFVLGRLVQRRGWNANYTRKLLGLVLLATPFCLVATLPYGNNPLLTILSFGILLACLSLFAEPLREKSNFLTTAFASIDRPEDRPHTLSWFISSYVVSSIILFVMMWWAVPSQPAYVFIAFIAVAVGDLLAGAVGHRFGRHRYETRGLFGERTYTRSWEGSACVFATTVAAVVFVGSGLPTGQFVAALIAMPIALTVAEAKSPHTWDEPVMFATAMLLSMAIIKAWVASAC